MHEQMLHTTKTVYNTFYGYSNKGIDAVEEVQKQVLSMGFDAMEKAPMMSELSGYVKQTREVQSELHGLMFSTVRKTTEEMKSMTDDMMGLMESAVKTMVPARA